MSTSRLPYHRMGRRGDPCTYCGEPAWTFDHVPPRSFVRRMASFGRPVSLDVMLRMVPSCHRCNVRLGKFPSADLAERRAFLGFEPQQNAICRGSEAPQSPKTGRHVDGQR